MHDVFYPRLKKKLAATLLPSNATARRYHERDEARIFHFSLPQHLIFSFFASICVATFFHHTV
jgi:hypothetical protein